MWKKNTAKWLTLFLLCSSSIVAKAQTSLDVPSERVVPIVFYLLDDNVGAASPSISIESPSEDQVFLLGDPIVVSASASDSDGTIAKVDLYIDDVIVNSDIQAPYQWSGGQLDSLPVGTHVLRVEATDNLGNSTSVSRSILVNAPNQPPTVSFLLPTQTVFEQGQSIAVEAAADDADGSVANVEFFLNGALVRQERFVPYTWNDTTRGAADEALNNLAVGQHILRLVATDNEGLQASVERTITIEPLVVNQPPTVSFLLPTQTTFEQGQSIIVEATADDADGSVANVEFFLNGVLVRQERFVPYTWNDTTRGAADEALNNLAVGQHALRLVATDNEGATSDVSRTITIEETSSNTPPQVTFVSPAAGQSFSQGVNVLVQVNATDIDGSISRVDLRIGSGDSALFHSSDMEAPYEWSLDNLPVGEQVLQITAVDNDGLESSVERSVIISESLSACNDGIDNDGDGLTDWQYDLGCYGAEDGSETAGTREQENGWTTFDLSADSRVIYVSSSLGNDANDGLTPQTAVATPQRGLELTRGESADVMLLRRGDVWRDPQQLSMRFHKGGRSASEKFIISSYGDSTARPRLEVSDNFINDHGREISNLAVMGLEIVSYRKEPNTPEFDGSSGGGFRFVGNTRSQNILLEDNFLKYGELVVQAVDNIEIRRNVIHRSYHVGTCSFREDGSRNTNGSPAFKPSGMFMGSNTDTALLEENVWDENGWNPDIPVGPNGACATIYNHNVYLANVKNVTVRNDLFLRASSIGLKVSGTVSGGIDGLTVTDSLFTEGEIGIAMGGNGRMADTHNNSTITNNVFTDINRSRPTTREFTWGITIENNNNTLYENNLFVNPPVSDRNAFAFGLSRDFNTEVVIRNNLVHGYNRALSVREADGWGPISITGNRFHTDSGGTGPLIFHRGDFSKTTYSGNAYYSDYTSSNPNRDGWFDTAYPFSDIIEWRTESGENNAQTSSFAAPDVGRNVDAYAAYLGVGTTLADFAREARKQSRFNYRPEYEAKAVNAYIREGYSE